MQLPNELAQARRDLSAEPINTKCLTELNRAAVQGREAVSPAACVGQQFSRFRHFHLPAQENAL
jgi:hypothetical protein